MVKEKKSVFIEDDVRRLANKYGYKEKEAKNNYCMLIFKHPSKKGCGGSSNEDGPVSVDVYFTTGTVTTSLDHPKAGKGQMQRKVTSLKMLEAIFLNPRVHSNVGYKKTAETRKKHRENGLRLNDVYELARKYRCREDIEATDKNQDCIVFHHLNGGRIRVWFRTATIGFRLTKDVCEEYFKKTTLASLSDIFRDPVTMMNRIKMSRAPLEEIQPSTSPNNTYNNNLSADELVGNLSLSKLKSLALDYNFVVNENTKSNLKQLKSKVNGVHVTINLFGNSTVTVQRTDHEQETYKNSRITNLKLILLNFKNQNAPTVSPGQNKSESKFDKKFDLHGMSPFELEMHKIALDTKRKMASMVY